LHGQQKHLQYDDSGEQDQRFVARRNGDHWAIFSSYLLERPVTRDWSLVTGGSSCKFSVVSAQLQFDGGKRCLARASQV
jgi:hypothetical protein